MRSKIFLILVFILISSLVSAIDTSITLKINPNAEVTLNVLNPETIQPYKVFVINSSEAGMASATFSGDVGIVAVSFVVRKEGKILQYKKASDYGNFSTSSPIYINTLEESNLTTNATTPDLMNNSTLVVNTTETTIQNTTNNTLVDTSSGITGRAVTDINDTNKSSFFSGVFVKIKSINYWKVLKILGYILLGIVILFILLFAAKKIRSKIPFSTRQLKSSQFTTVKYSGQEISEAERRISHAQEEIKKAQEEINLIKNRKSNVREAEKKFLEAKKELDRARGSSF